MRSLRRADSIALVGVAWGGVVLGHLLTYFLVYPSSPARAGHLADTGHGSFELAILSLVAAVPLALGVMTRRALGPRWTFSTKGTLIPLSGSSLPPSPSWSVRSATSRSRRPSLIPPSSLGWRCRC